MPNAVSTREAHAPHGRNGSSASRTKEGPLAAKELELMDAYWQACNYLSVGMIYLLGNPLLRPFELAILNETSRFHLVIDVIDRVPRLRDKAGHLKDEMRNAILDNMAYAHQQGADRPEIADWTWPD